MNPVQYQPPKYDVTKSPEVISGHPKDERGRYITQPEDTMTQIFVKATHNGHLGEESSGYEYNIYNQYDPANGGRGGAYMQEFVPTLVNGTVEKIATNCEII